MSAETQTSWRPWTTVGMLFAVQVMNRADKNVLGLAATALMFDLNLSPERYGFVASSFYFLYAATGLVVGMFIAHRVRPRLILAVLIAVWSLAQLPIIFAASFATLVFGRILLGMGEGNGTPTCINACHEWFPADKRNMPTAVVMSGATIGGLLTTPLLSILIDDHGWRSAFAACAIAGAAVLVVWLLLSRDGPYSGISVRRKDEAPAAPLNLREVFTDVTLYGSFILGLCSDWIVGFMIAWFAPFASLELGFTRVETGWLLAAVFLGHSILMLGVAAVSQSMLRRGVSSRFARAGLNGWCLVLAAVCFIVSTQVTDPYVRLALLGFGVGLPIVTFTLNPALLSGFLPSAHRNRIVHTMLAGMTLGSILAPWVTGKLVGDHGDEGWRMVLYLNAGIALVGALAAFVLINPERSARHYAGADQAGAPQSN